VPAVPVARGLTATLIHWPCAHVTRGRQLRYRPAAGRSGCLPGASLRRCGRSQRLAGPSMPCGRPGGSVLSVNDGSTASCSQRLSPVCQNVYRAWPVRTRRVAVDPGHLVSVLYGVASDFVLACPPHARTLAQPGENPVKNSHPGRMPRQPFVQADHHQPPPARPLLVQLVELVDHLLFVGGRVEAGEVEGGNVRVPPHRIPDHERGHFDFVPCRKGRAAAVRLRGRRIRRSCSGPSRGTRPGSVR